MSSRITFFPSQDFLNLDLERYQHGGVNITGFQLVNYSSPFVKTFLRKWNTLDANIWPGAGYNSIHVSIDTTMVWFSYRSMHIS